LDDRRPRKAPDEQREAERGDERKDETVAVRPKPLDQPLARIRNVGTKWMPLMTMMPIMRSVMR
jgi:hypothetical protein